jgi:hypothetical protein
MFTEAILLFSSLAAGPWMHVLACALTHKKKFIFSLSTFAKVRFSSPNSKTAQITFFNF